MRVQVLLQTVDGKIHKSDPFETEDTIEDYEANDSVMSLFTRFPSYAMNIKGRSRKFNPANILWVEVRQLKG